jgi:hypothetical protein
VTVIAYLDAPSLRLIGVLSFSCFSAGVRIVRIKDALSQFYDTLRRRQTLSFEVDLEVDVEGSVKAAVSGTDLSRDDANGTGCELNETGPLALSSGNSSALALPRSQLDPATVVLPSGRYSDPHDSGVAVAPPGLTVFTGTEVRMSGDDCRRGAAVGRDTMPTREPHCANISGIGIHRRRGVAPGQGGLVQHQEATRDATLLLRYPEADKGAVAQQQHCPFSAVSVGIDGDGGDDGEYDGIPNATLALPGGNNFRIRIGALSASGSNSDSTASSKKRALHLRSVRRQESQEGGNATVPRGGRIQPHTPALPADAELLLDVAYTRGGSGISTFDGGGADIPRKITTRRDAGLSGSFDELSDDVATKIPTASVDHHRRRGMREGAVGLGTSTGLRSRGTMSTDSSADSSGGESSRNEVSRTRAPLRLPPLNTVGPARAPAGATVLASPASAMNPLAGLPQLPLGPKFRRPAVPTSPRHSSSQPQQSSIGSNLRGVKDQRRALSENPASTISVPTGGAAFNRGAELHCEGAGFSRNSSLGDSGLLSEGSATEAATRSTGTSHHKARVIALTADRRRRLERLARDFAVDLLDARVTRNEFYLLADRALSQFFAPPSSSSKRHASRDEGQEAHGARSLSASSSSRPSSPLALHNATQPSRFDV